MKDESRFKSKVKSFRYKIHNCSACVKSGDKDGVTVQSASLAGLSILPTGVEMLSAWNFWAVLNSVYVEPVLFASFLGSSIYRISQSIGFYEVLCEVYYERDPRVDCGTGGTLDSTPVAEDFVQARASEWRMYSVVCYMVPGLLAGLLLGAWGDRKGRKVNILLGTFGTILGQLGYILILGDRSIPIYLILGTDFLAGFTGFFAIVYVSSVAFIVDTNLNPETLTMRLVILSVCGELGGVIGGLVAGPLTQVLSLPTVSCIGSAVVALGFILAVVRVPQVNPVELKRITREKSLRTGTEDTQPIVNEEIESISEPEPGPSTEPSPFPEESKAVQPKKGIFAEVFGLLKEAFQAYVKRREGKRRRILLLTILVFLVSMQAEAGLFMVISLYVLNRPLDWGASLLGYYQSVSTATSLLGTLFGGLLFKKVFHFRDSTLMLLAQFFILLKMLIIGLAHMAGHQWGTIMMFASTLCVFSNLFFAGSNGFIAQLVEPDEVGKIFAAFGFSVELGILFGSLIYNPMYSLTVSQFPGLVFMVAGGEILICMGIVVYIRMNSKTIEEKSRPAAR